MVSAVKNYTFEIEEIQGVGEVERFIEALSELKKDDSLKLEERKLIFITTTRADVAAALETIFKPVEIKKTWSKKPKPESNITLVKDANGRLHLEKNGNGKTVEIPEPAGFAPYQGG